MRALALFAAVSLSVFSVVGCAAPTGSDAQLTDEDAETTEDALTSARTHFPQCRAIGSKSEGFYWADSNDLIGWNRCEGALVTCDKFRTSEEGFYARGRLVAAGVCSTSSTDAVAALSKGLQYPSESDVAFDVLLVPGAGKGTLNAERLRQILKIDPSVPVETTTVGTALSPNRFIGHPDAAKFEALKKGLRGYRAFRVGTIQVQIHFVKLSGGDLQGLHTVSIET
jgi:hypothetical protein